MSPISEDELRARLRAVDPSPGVPGLAQLVIEHGTSRRRRRRWAVGMAAAAAVGVIGAGAVSVGDQIGRDDALPASPTPTSTPVEPTPVETTPVVTPTGTLTASPETSPTTSASSRPTGTATSSPSSTPTATSSPSSTPTATSFPSSAPTQPTPPPTPVPIRPGPSATGPAWEALHPISLLHDTSWTPTNAFPGPCGRDALSLAGLRDAYRYDARRSGGGEGQADREMYILFADEGGAAAFMDDLRAQSRTCSSTTGGATGGVVEQLSGSWSDGLALSHFSTQPNVTGGSVVLAVRSGRAVTLSSASGAFTRTDRVDPGLIQAARPSVEHVYPQLCGFTDAGC